MVVDREEIVDDVRRKGAHARVVAKGKRMKRQRPGSRSEGGIVTSCSSSAGDEGDVVMTYDESTMISSTEEEEDMAHCLILLAQGSAGGGKILPDVLAATTGPGFYVYECKTCNRVFPSFQALGGHRASHKKLKLLPPPPPPPPSMTVGEPVTPSLIVHDFDEEDRRFHKTAPLPTPLHAPGKTLTHGATSISGANKQKIHECGICGSEFGSGQALGGHMRRHRSAPAGRSPDANSTSNSQVSSDDKQSRNMLALDLNLPAPEDDRDTKFRFGSAQQPQISFLAGPALVDCHN
ncbi:hypothetical protein MLD38_017264 [Melastoma candidum]|uniref:Uncharacterized protein n=1 Tax=Melastoma candidum TaxID=119954 RepID=A0ACB9QQ95_9MYRT|nr:hypothetical protein MLD38_017264 [Melastoma candidum]